MQVTVAIRHFDAPESLRMYAEKEVGRLARYFDNVIGAHVILSTERHRCVAEANVQVYGTSLTSKQAADDMRTAIDGVVDKLVRQIKRYKEKLRDHKLHGEQPSEPRCAGTEAT